MSNISISTDSVCFHNMVILITMPGRHVSSHRCEVRQQSPILIHFSRIHSPIRPCHRIGSVIANFHFRISTLVPELRMILLGVDHIPLRNGLIHQSSLLSFARRLAYIGITDRSERLTPQSIICMLQSKTDSIILSPPKASTSPCNKDFLASRAAYAMSSFRHP